MLPNEKSIVVIMWITRILAALCQDPKTADTSPVSEAVTTLERDDMLALIKYEDAFGNDEELSLEANTLPELEALIAENVKTLYEDGDILYDEEFTVNIYDKLESRIGKLGIIYTITEKIIPISKTTSEI